MNTFALTFRALPGDDRPVELRVHRLLKLALRDCALKCVDAAPAIRSVAIADDSTPDCASDKRERGNDATTTAGAHPDRGG